MQETGFRTFEYLDGIKLLLQTLEP